MHPVRRRLLAAGQPSNPYLQVGTLNPTLNYLTQSKLNFSHTPDAHLNCAIIGDLVQLAAELERQLRGSTDGVMKHLKPAFFVAGSIAEGTRYVCTMWYYLEDCGIFLFLRVILANELDLTLSFESWKTHPPFAFNPEDPFNLYKSFPCPTWMEDFFDENEAFSLVRFSGYLFKIVQQGIHTTGIPCVSV